MGEKYEELVKAAVDLGALEAKLIETDNVVFDPRSHLKCRFGCSRWGRYWTCPPHLDLSYECFREAFDRYRYAVVIKTADPKAGQEVSLALEKKAMMESDCSFAFALALCVLCDECAFPDPCRFPDRARPSMDAYGVDIGKTLEPLGFKVEFDAQGKLLPAWYSMVLLD